MRLVGSLSTGARSLSRECDVCASPAQAILETFDKLYLLLESPKLQFAFSNFRFIVALKPFFHFSSALLALLSLLGKRNSIRKT